MEGIFDEGLLERRNDPFQEQPATLPAPRHIPNFEVGSFFWAGFLWTYGPHLTRLGSETSTPTPTRKREDLDGSTTDWGLCSVQSIREAIMGSST